MSKRFNEINGKDVDEFNESEENQNTKRKTELDVNLIHSYIASEAVWHVNRPPRMEELSPSKLDTYLSKFLLAVRKKNGEEYEPTTLRGIVSLVRKLRNYGDCYLLKVIAARMTARKSELKKFVDYRFYCK